MFRMKIAALMCILAVSSLVAADLPDGAVALFNGKNLDGWVAEGITEFTEHGETRPVWLVRNGLIECHGKGFGFLRYAVKEFDDFTLHLEYRIGEKGNSGIGIRTTPFDPKRSKDTRPSYACYEIQLLDDAGKPATPHSTGSLYRYVAPASNPSKPAGEWNTMVIDCVGPHIRIHLNGVKILDFDQRTLDQTKDKPLNGFICLQNHGRSIEFRNLHVRETK